MIHAENVLNKINYTTFSYKEQIALQNSTHIHEEPLTSDAQAPFRLSKLIITMADEGLYTEASAAMDPVGLDSPQRAARHATCLGRVSIG